MQCLGANAECMLFSAKKVGGTSSSWRGTLGDLSMSETGRVSLRKIQGRGREVGDTNADGMKAIERAGQTTVADPEPT